MTDREGRGRELDDEGLRAEDAAAFPRRRARLLSLGYRLTGAWADAEDAADEALARLLRLPAGERPREPDAWLTTVATRLCLDRLRRRAREPYVGPWLPEPVDRELLPDDAAVLADEVRMAVLVAYETLPPHERAALILREAFELPHPRIAEILEVSPQVARQWTTRARRRLSGEAAPLASPEPEEVEALLGAVMTGDLETVQRLLADDVRVVSDSDGRVNAARRVLEGPRRCGYFLVKSAESQDVETAPTTVNGEGALAIRSRGVTRVVQFRMAGGRVARIDFFCNPDKLTRVRLPEGWLG